MTPDCDGNIQWYLDKLGWYIHMNEQGLGRYTEGRSTRRTGWYPLRTGINRKICGAGVLAGFLGESWGHRDCQPTHTRAGCVYVCTCVERTSEMESPGFLSSSSGSRSSTRTLHHRCKSRRRRRRSKPKQRSEAAAHHHALATLPPHGVTSQTPVSQHPSDTPDWLPTLVVTTHQGDYAHLHPR